MLRLLSLILLLAGAGVAALGGWLFYSDGKIPAGLLGQAEIVLERTFVKPEPVADVAPEPAPTPASDTPITGAPPPPPPPPAAVEIEAPPVVAATPKKGTTSRSRSLTAPIVEAAPVEEPLSGVSEIIEQPAFTPEAVIVEAPAAPPPPPPSIEEQLYTVPIAYETPKGAAFNQSFTVTLSINAQDGAESATGGLSGSASTNVEEAVVQVTDQVKANLFGDAFAIEAKSPDIQKLSKFTESRWRWNVTPTKSGAQDLTFEIFAIHDDQASELVRTFDDTVTVEVSRIGQAMFLAQQYNPIMVIIAGFGSLLAGLFGVLRFFKGS